MIKHFERVLVTVLVTLEPVGSATGSEAFIAGGFFPLAQVFWGKLIIHVTQNPYDNSK
jgi:hypothetical protein